MQDEPGKLIKLRVQWKSDNACSAVRIGVVSRCPECCTGLMLQLKEWCSEVMFAGSNLEVPESSPHIFLLKVLVRHSFQLTVGCRRPSDHQLGSIYPNGEAWEGLARCCSRRPFAPSHFGHQLARLAYSLRDASIRNRHDSLIKGHDSSDHCL